MNLLNFTIIKLLFFLVAGIIFGFYSPINISISLSISLVLTLVLLTVLILTKKNNTQNIWFGLISYFLTFFVGSLCIAMHTESNQLKHYTNQLLNEEQQSLQIHIYKKLKPNKYHSIFVRGIQHHHQT